MQRTTNNEGAAVSAFVEYLGAARELRSALADVAPSSRPPLRPEELRALEALSLSERGLRFPSPTTAEEAVLELAVLAVRGEL